MLKKFLASVATVALSLAMVGLTSLPAGATDAGDEAAKVSVTAEFSAVNETCVSGQLVSGSVSVVLKDGITYALSGPNGAVPLVGGASGPIPSGTYTLTAEDSDPNDGFLATPLNRQISVVGYGYNCGYSTPQPVSPSVSYEAQSCEAGTLQGGFITVDLSVEGVTYTIDGGAVPFDPTTGTTGPLAPGDYLVEAVDADPNDAWELDYPFSTVVPIDEYDGYCEPTPVTPSVEFTNQVCEAATPPAIVEGFITVDLTVPGVTYAIDSGAVPFDLTTGATGPLTPGTYEVTAVDSDPNDGYELVAPFSEPITIAGYDGECGDLEPVTPAAGPTHQVCEATDPPALVQGFITVDLTVPGVTYSIEGGSIPFDPTTGMTGPLAPGTYVVTAVDSDPNDAYELLAPFSEPITVEADESVDCDQLPDFPIVAPFASSTPGSCTTNGSYTIGNDYGPGAVTWTANGEPVAEGPHAVAGNAVVNLVATAVGPDFGFAFGTQTEWTFPFTASTGCGDLTTLALTGEDGVAPMLTLAGFLSLLGLALMRRSRLQGTPVK